jgi:hypothetical protein
MADLRTPVREMGLPFAFLVFTLAGCERPDEPTRSIVEPLRGKIAFASESLSLFGSRKWLWHHEGRGLLHLGNLQDVDANLNLKNMVMVTFPSKSSLGRDLRHDPLTYIFDQGDDDNPGFAMIDVSDSSLRDHLAVAAHGVSGHICGVIESIDLTRPYSLTAEQDRPIPPSVYAETVRIPAVASLLEKPRQDRIAATITTLEAMGTRFHSSASGENTPEKVRELFRQADGGLINGLGIDIIETNQSSQASVVASIPGQKDSTTVIIGAHLDSIHRGGESNNAPGADDDASGVAVLVEALRVIAESGAKFQRRVEFHAYGAEEVGLLGSITIAQKYADDKRQVAGMMQVDMNAWSQDPADTTVHFVTTTTTPYLVRSSKDLLNTYLSGKFSTGPLNAGTSDHKSWFIRGFPVVFPFEKPSQYNPALHTEKDTSQNINNLPLAVRFSKLILAFLSHQAGIVTSAPEVEKLTNDTRTALGKDLKFAVVPSPLAANNFNINVATGQDIKSVDICRVNTRGSMVCNHERLTAKAKGNLGSRAVYALDLALALSTGDRVSVFGYNDQEKLIAQRTIKFVKK